LNQRPDNGAKPGDHGGLASAERARPDIDWLLAPIGFDAFVAESWDRAPVFIEGRGAHYYSEVYSLRDFDAALNRTGIRSPLVRLVREGREIPLATLSGGGCGRAGLLEDVLSRHRDGASIVLQFLHEQDGRLRDLCRDLSVALSAHAQVNAYLTPAGERGLATHYDTHDVFIMQLHGSKDWTLYERTGLAPFRNERGTRSELNDARPSRSLTLSPGDCLYMPRGWMHKAESRDASSLHLTIGVHPIRWAQVFQGAVAEVLRRDARFRRALPPGFANCEHRRLEAEVGLHELWSALTRAVDPGTLLAEAASAARIGIPPRLDGHLLDLDRLGEIDLSTRLRRRDIIGLSIEGDDTTVRVTYHGKTMECPAALNESLRFAIGSDGFAVGELPDVLTADDKLVLARRLVKEGLMTFADRQ
jgi:hypothetical protein